MRRPPLACTPHAPRAHPAYLPHVRTVHIPCTSRSHTHRISRIPLRLHTHPAHPYTSCTLTHTPHISSLPALTPPAAPRWAPGPDGRPLPAPHGPARPRGAPGGQQSAAAARGSAGRTGGAGRGGVGTGEAAAPGGGAVRCGAGRAPAMTIGGPRGGGQSRLQMPCLGKVSRHRAGTGQTAGGGHRTGRRGPRGVSLAAPAQRQLCRLRDAPRPSRPGSPCPRSLRRGAECSRCPTDGADDRQHAGPGHGHQDEEPEAAHHRHPPCHDRWAIAPGAVRW